MTKILKDLRHHNIIKDEMNSLENIIHARIKSHFSMDNEEIMFNVCNTKNEDDSYSEFINRYNLTDEERVILLLAMSKEMSPQILDPFLSKNSLYDSSFTEFGGLYNSNIRGFTPTIQTALFILCGTNQSLVLKSLKLFDNQATLFKENILISDSDADSIINSKLLLSKSTMHYFFSNSDNKYDYTQEFPASLLESNHEWSDLVFSQYTKEHLEELEIWLSHSDELLNEWGMRKSLKAGYKALFYGPPGTGKSLTAALLGKKIGKSVYRIDLSQIVSKYIGETEKNLEKVFLQAEEKDWILFFDEADSIFGKRTQVNSSNDRYANQGTSYLLQRIDESKNMIILASNFKDNFDEAYLRRFQSIIYFPLPEKDERLMLWKKGFSKKASLKNLDLVEIASEYELSGATIINVIRYASLMAIKRDSTEIIQSDILKAIRREKFKEGKII